MRKAQFKNIFKRLSAAVVAAALGFCAFGATVSARQESSFLVSDNEDQEMLERLLSGIYSEKEDFLYFYGEITYEECLELLIPDNGNSLIYKTYFTDFKLVDSSQLPQSVSTTEDDSLFEEETDFNAEKQEITYGVYSKSNLEWLIKNVLFADPSVMNTFSRSKTAGLLFDGEKFYSEIKADKAQQNISIKDMRRVSNGKYRITVSASNKKELTAVAALTEKEGIRHWRIYYLGSNDNAQLIERSLADDPMQMLVDSNSYVNSSTSFISLSERARYYMDSSALGELVTNQSPTVQNLVREYAVGGWDGSGYGIAFSMLNAYKGIADVESYGGRADKSYYWIDAPVNNLKLRSYINYCQTAQLLQSDFSAVSYDELLFPEQEQKPATLKYAVSRAQEYEPFVMIINWKDSTGIRSQAVVCFDYRELPNGEHGLLFIDPNNRSTRNCLAVNADYSECYFKNSYYDGCEIIGISCRTNGFRGYEKGFADKECLLLLERNQSLTIVNAEGQELILKNGAFSGDMPYNFENYIANGAVHQAEILISIKNSDSFIFETEEGSMDITLSGSNGVFCGVDGTNIKKVTAKKSFIALEGNNMAYSVSALSGQESVDMVNIRGGETREITFTTEQSLIVSGERKQNVKIAVVLPDGQIKECDYLPGDYEYTVTGELVEQCLASEKQNTTKVLFFFICFGCIILMSFVVIVIMVSDRRGQLEKLKNRRKGKKKQS